MGQVRDQVVRSEDLNRVRLEASGDFAAIALIDPRDNRIRWEYVSGNVSDRLHLMTKKPGSGIVGQVVRYGRSFIIDYGNPALEEERLKYPIMLIEKLLCVMAVPIMNDQRVAGVMLVGNRTACKYTDDQLRSLQLAAKEMAE